MNPKDAICPFCGHKFDFQTWCTWQPAPGRERPRCFCYKCGEYFTLCKYTVIVQGHFRMLHGTVPVYVNAHERTLTHKPQEIKFVRR